MPGIGVSPDKMLLARIFSYADAHRARIGVNYKQIPVNAPRAPVHSYSKDGAMRVQNVSDPVYAPNSKGGPKADPQRHPYAEKWEADGEFVHSAYTLRSDDDDWGQAGTLVRDVMDDAARDRLVANVVGHLSDGVSASVLERAFEYWRNVDKEIGDRIAQGFGERLSVAHRAGGSALRCPVRPARDRDRARDSAAAVWWSSRSFQTG